MIAEVKNNKVFLNLPSSQRDGLDLSPRVINKRKIEKGNGSEFPQINRFEDILTVELSCLVDQRELLRQNVSVIKIFVSPVSLGTLRKRVSVLNPLPVKRAGPAGISSRTSLVDQSIEMSKTKKTRRKSKSQKIKELSIVKDSKVSTTNMQSNFINIVNDFDMISQNVSALRSSSLNFLAKINVNQILSSAKIKNIHNLSQTDAELFGEREFFEVTQLLDLKARKLKRSAQDISIPISILTDEKSASESNFRSTYFSKVKLGKDPLSSFQHPDNFVSLQENLKGISAIKKHRKDELREVFRIIAQEESNNRSDSGNVRITKNKETKRNEIYKTTFEISRIKLRTMAAKSEINLIFFAYDKRGVKIDSYSQVLNTNQLFSTEVNPTIDFDIGITRSARGNIITRVNNREMMNGTFNVYQKFFSKSQNYKRKSFKLFANDFDVRPNNAIRLVDGKVQGSGRPLLTKTKSVFHRITSNFQNEEIFNTYAAGVAPSESHSSQPSCAVYVTMNEGRGEITITNLSEDVFAVLPVKRVAKGTRGSNFTTVQQLIGTALTDNTKSFIEKNDTDAVFSFFDDDLEDDVIYEYAAILYNKSGFPQVSGSRFLEKNVERENLITAEVKSEILNFSNDDEGAPTVGIKFNVTLNRQEDDVDKIINSLFGDNRRLFEDDLKEIKDASNLIYGIRVHKIDSSTGEFSFVGSFRGSKQTSTSEQPDTDIQKTYKVEFEDFSPAASMQIYKIDPYLIPPAQVLDKVFDSLLQMVKTKNRSNSPINKMLVSKQKILNQAVVSKIGTKFASIKGRKGSISSNAAFVEKNRNDLFLEGITGDIVYANITPGNILPSFNQFNVIDSNISVLKTLDTNENTTNFIPKNLVNIEFSVGNFDNFVDFYVVLRKENGINRIVIDGAIHSTDLTDDRTSMNYKYLSKVKTSVGLISYFIVPISKLGTKGPVNFLGTIVLRGS